MPLNGDMPVASRPSWTAVIPIRSFSEGKTRLMVPSTDTGSLIRAFAHDVIEACRACPRITRIVVVSPDASVIAEARALGVESMVEQAPSGINEAVATVRAQVSGPVIAILGDTPCLTGEALDTVLHEADQHEVSFVADASGVGSTLWCTLGSTSATSHFGHHSRARHRADGAVELGVGITSTSWTRARRDVDTDVDLWDAHRIGLGPATARLVERESLP